MKDIAGIEDRTRQIGQKNSEIVTSSYFAALPRKPNEWPPTYADEGGKSVKITFLFSDLQA